MLLFAKYAYILFASLVALPVILDSTTRQGATHALLSWKDMAKSQAVVTLTAFLDRVDPRPGCSASGAELVFLNASFVAENSQPFGPKLPQFDHSLSPNAFCAAYLDQNILLLSPSPSLPRRAMDKQDEAPLGESSYNASLPSVQANTAIQHSATRNPALLVAAAVALVSVVGLVIFALFRWYQSRRPTRIVRLVPRRKERTHPPRVIKPIPATPHRRHLQALFVANLEPDAQPLWQQVAGAVRVPEVGGLGDPFVAVGEKGKAILGTLRREVQGCLFSFGKVL